MGYTSRSRSRLRVARAGSRACALPGYGSRNAPSISSDPFAARGITWCETRTLGYLGAGSANPDTDPHHPMWRMPPEERRIVVSTHEYRRGNRRMGLLLGAAFLAIG